MQQIQVAPCPTAREDNNPYYPLPPDYPSLTEEGRRHARVNACRQNLLDPVTVQHEAMRLWRGRNLTIPQMVLRYKRMAAIASVRFFEAYYLLDDEEENHYPGHYSARVPPAPFHEKMIADWSTHPYVMYVCPRGSAKSTVAELMILHQLVTRPGRKQMYLTSISRNVKERGYRTKIQCYGNERIRKDWDVEYGRPLKPPRSEAPQGFDHFYLGNGSSLSLYSANSALRGGRPDDVWIDDPERDESASTSMETIRQYMSRLLFTVVMPMVTRPDTTVRWQATLITKQHYAAHVVGLGDSTDDLGQLSDLRFSDWSRNIVPAIRIDKHGKERSCWPAMWPLTEADKMADPRLADTDVKSLETIRQQLGEPVFQAEYMANPGSGFGSHFPELTHDLHGYRLEGEWDDDPYSGDAEITFHDERGLPIKMPVTDFLKKCRLFCTGDTSYTSSMTSDFKAFTVLAIYPGNLLFVLDAWNRRCKQHVLTEAILRACDRWRVASLHPERVKGSIAWVEELLTYQRSKAWEALRIKRMPAIRPFNPGMIDKGSRITGALDMRMQQGLIKLPLFRRNQNHWRNLFDQILGFNPEARNNGLANDDLIDCVGMSGQIIRHTLAATLDTDPDAAVDPLTLFREGRTHLPDGTAIHEALPNWKEVITLEDLRTHRSNTAKPSTSHTTESVL